MTVRVCRLRSVSGVRTVIRNGVPAPLGDVTLPRMSGTIAELDGLSTEELRKRAFAKARQHGDVKFFWNLLRHLPHADDAESLDGSLGAVGASIDDAVALWREMTGHGYGESEPLLRAAFIDYLTQ
ncbi:hypothetical protein Val02_87150 [Virgisporangium aliadipatigenens]|uniref:Uncharacterized protein n=2 Tax=Virgisporangium aliadipatigenens TaxID=741659 RepID=A0A8J3YTX2_9ACTN|nr:hypothetical protein Val02_87150 [Virgisporangium aliadipatigenens]